MEPSFYENLSINKSVLAEKLNRDPYRTYDLLTFEQTQRLLQIKQVLVAERVWNEFGEPRDAKQFNLLYRKLRSVRSAFKSYRRQRARSAVYSYLQSVFALVSNWFKDGSELWHARWCLLLTGKIVPKTLDPFAAVISCTVDHREIHRLTISKWARALSNVIKHKRPNSSLATFIKAKGGINGAAKGAQPRRRRGQRATGGKAKK